MEFKPHQTLLTSNELANESRAEVNVGAPKGIQTLDLRFRTTTCAKRA